MNDIFTPKQDMSIDYDGAPVYLRAGVTTVREGHPIIDGREDLFEAVSDYCDYDIVKTRRKGKITIESK